MTDIAKEVSSLNFKSLLGGPLTAIVQAQVEAAQQTMEFVKSIGFKENYKKKSDGSFELDKNGNPILIDRKPTMVTFDYQKSVIDPNNPQQTTLVDRQLKVPYLTMVPIPYLNIDEATIDFNVRINSVEEMKSSESLDVGASLALRQGWGTGGVKLKASVSYKKSTEKNTSVDRTYSMKVHMKVSQSEMPSGLEKILGLLENSMEDSVLSDSDTQKTTKTTRKTNKDKTDSES